MYARFQELMTEGFSLSNKFYFGEWNPDEFAAWIKDCQNLLSCCEPEPYFPSCSDHRHIEEIVMLLQKVSSEISRGQVEYLGIL
jgi:hypothetical protein